MCSIIHSTISESAAHRKIWTRSRTGPTAPPYEAAGLGPEDVDIFNPYDGYAPMTQFFLEGFQWHGVKRGDAFAFYASDIRVEGPHPFCSNGCNLGTGHSRMPVHR